MILRFGVFFDGTGNNQHNVMPTESNGGKGASYTNALSNVALLHALYPAEGPSGDGAMAILSRYVEGWEPWRALRIMRMPRPPGAGAPASKRESPRH